MAPRAIAVRSSAETPHTQATQEHTQCVESEGAGGDDNQYHEITRLGIPDTRNAMVRIHEVMVLIHIRPWTR